MRVHNISVFFNLNKEENGSFVKEVVLNSNGNVAWTFSEDDSVDLAVLPMVPNRQIVDVLYIGMEEFATTDVLEQNHIAEGEPIFFAGFFYQFPGVATTNQTATLGRYLPFFICTRTTDQTQCDPNAQGDPFNAGFSGAAQIEPIVIAPANSGTDVKYMRGVAGVQRLRHRVHAERLLQRRGERGDRSQGMGKLLFIEP